MRMRLARGWVLVGTYSSGWNARVVTAATNFDGMCRPLGFQAFVFSSGTFAGTLSPTPMDSRTDGAIGNVYLRGSISPQASVELNADFARYKDSDPLCCPAATSSVSYQLAMVDGKPLVKPTQAYTNPNSRN